MNNQILKIDGKTKENLNYYISVSYDDIPVDDMDFENEEQRLEYIGRFNSGELLNVYINVEVFSKSGQVSGSNGLGGCHVKSEDLETEIKSMVDDYGMLEEAEDDLKTVLNQIKTIDLGLAA